VEADHAPSFPALRPSVEAASNEPCSDQHRAPWLFAWRYCLPCMVALTEYVVFGSVPWERHPAPAQTWSTDQFCRFAIQQAPFTGRAVQATQRWIDPISVGTMNQSSARRVAQTACPNDDVIPFRPVFQSTRLSTRVNATRHAVSRPLRLCAGASVVVALCRAV